MQKAVLKYPGAKHRIAPWILRYIPAHQVYLEPFFGSGAIFFGKEPCRIETINDLNGDVVNYFRVVREHPEEFAMALSLTPFARDEYESAFTVSEDDSDVEKARKFAVRCWQGFGCSNRYRNGFRSSQRHTSPQTTKEWADIPDRIMWASRRLKEAQIENLPAVELIKRYDTSDVFIYLDPPYLPETRKKYLYVNEMNTDEHEELLWLIKDHPGKVLISGYDNDMYNSFLSGWKKVHKETQAEFGHKRVETLWMNYDKEQQMNIFDLTEKQENTGGTI